MTWEDARYLIEYKSGLHSPVKQHKASLLMGAYIEGYLWDDQVMKEEKHNWRDVLKIIPKTRLMKPTDRVVVVIRPADEKYAPHVPTRFRPVEVDTTPTMEIIEFTPDMTDDQKIELLSRVQETRTAAVSNAKKAKTTFHVSDLLHNPQLIVPSEFYLCDHCGHSGHFKNHCILVKDPNFISATRLKFATGIPKTFLKSVQDKDITSENAFVAADGTRYVQDIKIRTIQ